MRLTKKQIELIKKLLADEEAHEYETYQDGIYKTLRALNITL